MVMFKLCFSLFESGTVYPGCVTRNLSINFRGFKQCGQKGQFLIFEEKESVRSDSNLAPASVKNANASKPSHLFEPDATSSPDLIKCHQNSVAKRVVFQVTKIRSLRRKTWIKFFLLFNL